MQSTPNFPKNEHFLPPEMKEMFFGKFGDLCILVTSVLRFAIFTYYRQNVSENILQSHIVMNA